MESSRKKILIVDDEEDIRVELAEYLARKGYDPICANDGEEAIATFLQQRVDAIVTDVKMPKCDGHELIRFIRGRDLNLPIIALTGHYSLIDLDKLNEAGASLTIKKPILLGDLLGSLQHLLL